MKSDQKFTIWTFGDAHVGTDIKYGRESLAQAIRQVDDLDWDIALNAGDMSGEQGLPKDAEGEEITRQFNALKKHKREDIYSVCGNHDRSGLGEPEAHWWRKWIDPVGENTVFSGVDPKLRKYAPEGNWERYSFSAGNLLFLMMSDINEPTQRKGRGELGGNPGGVVSLDTFNWWKSKVEENRDKIIITMHHYVLRDTTVASGDWEGMQKDEKGQWRGKYHGYKPEGTPKGASYLYWVGGVPGSEAFVDYLKDNPGATDIWIGGHTHTNPDDVSGGKSHIEKKNGTYFINTAALTGYHVRKYTVPMSRFLEFTHGSEKVRVKCYLHTDSHSKKGWYEKAERTLYLSKKFAKQ